MKAVGLPGPENEQTSKDTHGSTVSYVSISWLWIGRTAQEQCSNFLSWLNFAS